MTTVGKIFTTLLRFQLIIVCAWVRCEPTSAQGGSQIPDPIADVRTPCTTPQYSSPPQPDLIDIILKSRKRYRLVIGAGEYKYDSEVNNRTFVEPSAIDVDSRLNELHFDPLPGVRKGGTPYLTGKRANRAEVTAALNEMANLTKGEDFGIIYYVGHGNVTYDGNDLTLGLYDEVVGTETGLHATGIFGIMTNKNYHTSIKEIPHLFIILDSCFSGTVAQPLTVDLQTINGNQRLVQILGGGPIIPDQVSVLTSTAAGSTSSAYELQGTGRSAFSYYFSRALKEDWICSDSLSQDGILTLLEMKEYLGKSLALASSKGVLEKPMEPQMLARDVNSLLAYRPDKYSQPGFRDLIYSLLIKPSQNNATAQVTLPGDVQTTCSNSTSGCIVPVSKAYADSNITVAMKRGQLAYSKESVKLSDLVNGSKTILGVKLEVHQSTTGCNSPAIAGVTGDVNINVNAPCVQESPMGAADRLQGESGSKPAQMKQNAPGSNNPTVGKPNGSAKDNSNLSSSTSIQQATTGACSPPVADVQGNVTITCAGVGPAPAFLIYVVEQSASGYKFNQTEFTYADIQKNSSYSLFRKLLAQIPSPISAERDVVIFRLHDENVVGPASDTNATSGGNLGVLVIPSEVIQKFGSSHLAFTYFKSAIDGK